MPKSPHPSLRRALPLCALLLVLAFCQFFAACRTSAPITETPPDTETRNPLWATPLDCASPANLHQVTPCLYRSALPDAASAAELRRLGINNILDLRLFGDHPLANENFTIQRVTMSPFAPSRPRLLKALKIILDCEKANEPLLVHCQHGADRTGLVCAAWRCVRQGWTPAEAVAEMRYGGYGFHDAYFQNLINFLKELDIKRCRRELGLET
jgi:protein tyrosine/serine phosphatase